MAKVLIVESAKLKFSEFIKSLGGVHERYHNDPWFIKMREIDAKMHSDNMGDKVNFSDDRITFIAYKVMCETNAFTRRADVAEWWIADRYANIFLNEAEDGKNIDTLREFIRQHIGYNFTGATMDDKATKEFEALKKSLSKTIFSDDFPKIPDFIQNAITGEEPDAEEEETEEVEETEFEEFVLSEEERKAWEKLLDDAETALETAELEENEIEEYKQAIEVANMMLETN